MTATTARTAAEVAAEKFAALAANLPTEPAAPGDRYVTENGLFVVNGSKRINKEVRGFLWSGGYPRTPLVTGNPVGYDHPMYRQVAERIEDSLIYMARVALGVPQARDDSRPHQLAAVIWSDGSWSWASFRWSLFGGESEPGYLYIDNGNGSTYLTVRFEKETMRHPIR